MSFSKCQFDQSLFLNIVGDDGVMLAFILLKVLKIYAQTSRSNKEIRLKMEALYIITSYT